MIQFVLCILCIAVVYFGWPMLAKQISQNNDEDHYQNMNF